MHKQLLVAFLLFGLSCKVSAQIVATPTPVSKQDTTQAVHTLFQKHRTGGWIWTAIGGAFAVRIISATASSDSDVGGNTGGTVVGVAVLGGVPAGIGIGKLTRFSKAKEEQTVQLYEKSAILPPYVQKRLKRKYFAR